MRRNLRNQKTKKIKILLWLLAAGPLVLLVGYLFSQHETLLLTCPKPIPIQGFNPHLYLGRWYETAYKDALQFKMCRCFKFDFGQVSPSVFSFQYFATCPGPNGFAEYPLYSTVKIDSSNPNVFREDAITLNFENNIIKVYGTKTRYDRAIQFQCKSVLGLTVYVGFNLVSRKPELVPSELNEMIADIKTLGLAPFGGTHEGLTPLDASRCAIATP